MGIVIKPGIGESAYRELWSFTNAYPTIDQGTDTNGNRVFVLFDASDVGAFQDMEQNELIGTFDPFSK